MLEKYEGVCTKDGGSLEEMFEQARSILKCMVRASSYETEKEGIRDKGEAGNKEAGPTSSSPVARGGLGQLSDGIEAPTCPAPPCYMSRHRFEV